MKHLLRTVSLASLAPIVVLACSADDGLTDPATGSTEEPGVAQWVARKHHWGRSSSSSGGASSSSSSGGASSSSSGGASSSSSSGGASSSSSSGGASSSSSSGGAATDAGAKADASDGATTNSQCLFPCDNPWYRDVSALPADTSHGYIASIGSWGASNRMIIDFSIVTLEANASTPKRTFKLDADYDPDNDHDPVPVPTTGTLEGENGYACTQDGDCHLIVHDVAQNKLFELWKANYANGAWSAVQETVWDLTKHYGPEGRGYGCTSADAAGFAIMPGLIRPSEVASGEVRHALRFILPGDRILKNGYVAPATHSTNVYSGRAPMGLRLRLRASFDENTLSSKGAKVVARALKKYGMLLADAGQDALTAESDAFSSVKWSGLLSGSDLVGLKVSDFEAVDVGTVKTPSSMDCTRAP
jgi:hypothetical protein